MPLSDRRLASIPDAPDAADDTGTPASKPSKPRGRTKTGGIEPLEAPKKAAAPTKPADKLAKLGLKSDIDLVLHLPMRYEDETTLTPIGELIPGDNAQTEGVVYDNEIKFRPRRQLLVKIQRRRRRPAHAALPQFLRLAGQADGGRRRVCACAATCAAASSAWRWCTRPCAPSTTIRRCRKR